MTIGLVIVGLSIATLPESADAATTCSSGDHKSDNYCIENSKQSKPIIPKLPPGARPW